MYRSRVSKKVNFVEHVLSLRPHPVGNANLLKIESRRLGGDFKTEMRAYPVSSKFFKIDLYFDFKITMLRTSLNINKYLSRNG